MYVHSHVFMYVPLLLESTELSSSITTGYTKTKHEYTPTKVCKCIAMSYLKCMHLYMHKYLNFIYVLFMSTVLVHISINFQDILKIVDIHFMISQNYLHSLATTEYAKTKHDHITRKSF